MDMIYDNELEAEGDYNDSERGSYSSEEDNPSGESEDSSADSINGTLDRPGSGGSHVFGKVQGTDGSSGRASKVQETEDL